MNYNFEIGQSFAGINFNFPVKKTLKLLGKPDKTYKDDFSLYFQYNNLGLYLTYEKENKNGQTQEYKQINCYTREKIGMIIIKMN